MPNRDTDILQIKKYLNGELDAKAMHQLERRAQGDPFLMDALEGFENTPGDEKVPLAELSQRLNQRIEKKERRIIPWRAIGIAASVLVVFSAGGLWFYNSKPAESPKITAVVKPEAITPAPPAVADTTRPEKLNEVAVAKPMQTATESRKAKPDSKHNAVMASLPPASPVIANAVVKDKDTESEEGDTSTNRLDEMVVMDYAKKKKDAAIAANSKLAAAPMTSANLIEGKVIGKDDGLPIAGAIVKFKGTNIGAVTDINGRFTLPADSNKKTIAVANIGYQTVEVNSRSALQTITLQPTGSSLSEVVTSGFTRQKNIDGINSIAAHPQNGWGSFKKYLKANATSPDGKTGVVKVAFEVSAFGAISNVAVVKSLSPAADKKALDLINNGPPWIGNTGGKAEMVTERIRFEK